MAQNCEFKGVEATLQGFDLQVANNDSPLFSIWYGKDLRFPSMEQEPAAARAYFEQLLDVLNQGGSSAIYTIKFHDTPNRKTGKIDNTTPVCGSFNFRLFDANGPAVQGERYYQYQPQTPAPSVSDKLSERFQEIMLQRMMKQLDAADEQAAIAGPGSDYDSKQQFIVDIANSEMGSALIGMIRDFLPKRRHMPQAEPGHVSGINFDTDEDVLKCVNRLRAKDPEFDTHLSMLAHLAENSPFFYNKAIKKLKEVYE